MTLRLWPDLSLALPTPILRSSVTAPGGKDIHTAPTKTCFTKKYIEREDSFTLKKSIKHDLPIFTRLQTLNLFTVSLRLTGHVENAHLLKLGTLLAGQLHLFPTCAACNILLIVLLKLALKQNVQKDRKRDHQG